MGEDKRCYRICFRGMVSLVLHPYVGAPKTGHYLSYGDVILTSSAQKFAATFPLKDFEQSSRPLYQSTSFHKNNSAAINNGNGMVPPRIRQRVEFVHVAQILTSGVPMSDQQIPTHSHSSPHTKSTESRATTKRGCNVYNKQNHSPTLFSIIDSENNNENDLSFPSIESQSNQNPLHDLNVSYLSAVEDDELSLHAVDQHDSMESDQSIIFSTTSPDENLSPLPITQIMVSSSFGYLMISRPLLDSEDADASCSAIMQVAEPCLPPVLHEQGSFLYRVCSTHPISALNGPALDAPPTKTVLNPGQVIQVECKIQFARSPHDDVDDEESSQNIMFLRLKHRRGWIPDQQPSQLRREKNKTNALVEEISSNSDSRTCVSMASSTTASSLSVHSDFDVHSILSQPTPHRSRRYRHPVSQILTSMNSNRSCHHSNYRDELRHISSSATKSDVSSLCASGTFEAASVSNNSLGPSRDSIQRQVYHLPCSMTASKTMATAKTEVLSNSYVSLASASKRKPNIFLFRVIAPKGLKILDNPHFQVSSLIWGQSNHSSSSPFLFVNNGQRFLPRGAIFEASSKLERVSLPDRKVAELIKLSDGSGWAMIPTSDELKVQYQQMMHKSGSVTNGTTGSASVNGAVDEVGNAILPSSALAEEKIKRVWLRICPRNGVVVSCPPPPPNLNQAKNGHDEKVCGKSSSSDAQASCCDGKNSTSRFGVLPNHPTLVISPSVIPCGFVVEAEPWEENSAEVLKPISSDALQSQYFVRLKVGGWIPRHLYGETVYQRVKDPPAIRRGSFWFRVLSKNGITVRQGPSRRANTIQSEKGDPFRFECGEILRVSEILSFGGPTLSPSQTEDGQQPSVEIFAKLYRNSKTNTLTNHGNHFYELVQHGEWVQVYGRKKLNIEECIENPIIERNVDGWIYEVVCHAGAKIRRGPSQAAEQTGHVLKLSEIVCINERVLQHNNDKMIWLRLKDGRGWISNVEEEHKGRLLMRLRVSGVRDSTKNILPIAGKKAGFMSRLFSD